MPKIKKNVNDGGPFRKGHGHLDKPAAQPRKAKAKPAPKTRKGSKRKRKAK